MRMKEILWKSSVDNIDFLYSYACVFKGNRQSSWHGTTIKPLPSLEYARGREENGMEINVPQIHVRKRSERPSPMPSPHKDLGLPIYKKQRRDRTGVEKHLSLTATDIATMVVKYNTHTCSMQNSAPLSLDDFLTSIEEQGALSDLHP